MNAAALKQLAAEAAELSLEVRALANLANTYSTEAPTGIWSSRLRLIERGASTQADKLALVANSIRNVADAAASKTRRPDPLGEALNSGDGVYRP